jgi:hypothetical protein
MAAVAEHALTLTDLPLPLAHKIMSLLPVDARACAACVCRGWCHVVSERSLWTRLNLSPFSGVRVRVTDAVLAGAAAKARGQLAALDVLSCDDVAFDALLAVVTANAGALRELHIGAPTYDEQNLDMEMESLKRLLQAAPQLAACEAAYWLDVDVADARRMLRNEPPFQPLCVLALTLDCRGVADEASVLALAADLAAHASLQRVELREAPLNNLVALDAVVDAALARQFGSLQFSFCHLSPASVPALARLLRGGTLTQLIIFQNEAVLDGPSAALLGDALRANATLTSLSLEVDLWQNTDAAAALLGALTGHRSVRELRLHQNHVLAGAATVGATLGTLVAANAPALTQLDVSHSRFGDAGLRPLIEALAANTHLRALDVTNNDMSVAFARDVLLPAVRANTSLRTLMLGGEYYDDDDDDGDDDDDIGAVMRGAEALVAARAAAAAAV